MSKDTSLDCYTTRSRVYDQLISIFNKYKLNNPSSVFHIEQLSGEIENAIYNESIKILIQIPDAIWKPIYLSFVSNLVYNITEYINSHHVIEKIITNSKQEMLRIIINGPLALNEYQPEIAELIQYEQDNTTRVKVYSNTGGSVYCPKCRQTNIYRQLVQDRGGDEAFSSYLSCLQPECGYQWRRGGG